MKGNTGFLLIVLFLMHGLAAQSTSNALFQSEIPLLLKSNFSKKRLLHKTNDSTYIKSQLLYKSTFEWENIEILLRVRGHFRKANCKNTPLKIKIPQKTSKGTLFEGNKSLKLVLPCQSTPLAKDYLLKEYIAYQIYAKLSPLHFKTRKVVFNVKKTKKDNQNNFFNGFIIEDDKTVAKRFKAKIFNQKIVLSDLDARSTTVHSFFQFLIGNTDFIFAPPHNLKRVQLHNQIQILPYDFDLTGFVNPDYAHKSAGLGKRNLEKRQYKGLKRNRMLLEEVRSYFLSLEQEIFALVEKEKSFFSADEEYIKALNYIASFYAILKEDSRFETEIVQAAQ